MNMNMLRMFRYALIIQMVWIIIGCCSEHHTITYQWASMKLVHLDNSGAEPLEADGLPVPAAAYGIRMTLKDSAIITGMHFSPLPVAYATSCYEVYTYINRDTVLDLHIHSLTGGVSGELKDVTSDFLVLPLYFSSSATSIAEEFISIPALVQSLNSRPSPLQRINLIKIRNMEQRSDIQFIVTMDLTGGKTLADTTVSVTLI